MKLTWKNIKEYIYIGVIITGSLLWWRDEVNEDAVSKAAMSELQKDVSEIKSTQQIKFQMYDTYWMENTESMAVIGHILGVAP